MEVKKSESERTGSEWTVHVTHLGASADCVSSCAKPKQIQLIPSLYGSWRSFLSLFSISSLFHLFSVGLWVYAWRGSTGDEIGDTGVGSSSHARTKIGFNECPKNQVAWRETVYIIKVLLKRNNILRLNL